MGIYDRDYYRDDPPGGGLLGGSGAVCKRILAVTIAVFVAQCMTYERHGGGLVTQWLSLDVNELLHGQVWRLVTYAFCHDPGSIWHIVWNMYFLWMFGQEVEQIYGPREFLKFYLAAAIFSGLAYVGLELALSRAVPDIPPCVGASGALSAVLVVCAMYYPTKSILIFFFIPVQLRFLVWINLVFDLLPVLLSVGGNQAAQSVAHSAHLGGMLYGFLYMRLDLRFSRLFGGWTLRRIRKKLHAARTPVRIYEPPEPSVPADLDERVDEILAKITAQGEASLTDAERDVLKEASRRYKGKT